MESEKLQLFEDQRIRTAWDEEKEEWYFSIVDVVGALTEAINFDASRKYWNKVKQRMVEEGNELVTNCHQLKLKSPKDGKRYNTDVATTEELLRIIQSISSKKAEPFKLWLGRQNQKVLMLTKQLQKLVVLQQRQQRIVSKSLRENR